MHRIIKHKKEFAHDTFRLLLNFTPVSEIVATLTYIRKWFIRKEYEVWPVKDTAIPAPQPEP